MNCNFNEYGILEKEMAKLVRDIVAERERQGISQGRLAEMAGIKQSAISRIESLRALPQLDTLLKLLRPLNLKLTVVQRSTEECGQMDKKLSGITALDIEFSSCKLTVTKSDDEDFYFTTEDEDEFVIVEREGVADIRQKRSIFKNFLERPIEVGVKLPASFEGSGILKNKNGAMYLSGVKFDGLQIQSDNGKISLQDVEARKVAAETDNGKIVFNTVCAEEITATTDNGKIEACNTKADSLSAETDNGKIEMQGLVAQKIELKSDNGRIVLEDVDSSNIFASSKNGRIVADLKGNEEEYCLEVNSKSGSSTVGGKRYSGCYVYKDKDRSRTVSAQTKNGSINIAFADTDEKYKRLQEDSGEQNKMFFDFTDFNQLGDMIKNATKVFKKQVVSFDEEDDDQKVIVVNKGKVVLVGEEGEKETKIVTVNVNSNGDVEKHVTVCGGCKEDDDDDIISESNNMEGRRIVVTKDKKIIERFPKDDDDDDEE